MHYFEFENPYYALIRASSKEKAKGIYRRVVLNDDNEPIDEIKEVSRDYALLEFSRGEKENVKLPEIEQVLKHFAMEDKDEILLIDGSLI
ncbi:hypothetical protein [Virgibacillus sp. CBA3643]|uniref:hypothetical protein n=1 Tax=Virgibacillus sp. CBA3643 TaxID=2942278 RepID=UPI0035A38BEB